MDQDEQKKLLEEKDKKIRKLKIFIIWLLFMALLGGIPFLF